MILARGVGSCLFSSLEHGLVSSSQATSRTNYRVNTRFYLVGHLFYDSDLVLMSSASAAVIIFCIGVIVQTAAFKPSSIYGGLSGSLVVLINVDMLSRSIRHRSGRGLIEYGRPTLQVRRPF